MQMRETRFLFIQYILCAAAVFMLLLPSPLQSQSLTEYILVDSLEAGDTFTYTLTLNKDREYDHILFPDSAHFGSATEIRSRQQFRVTNFRDSLQYNLQYFGTEDSRIPPLPVHLVTGTDTVTLYTSPVPLYFKTVLQADEEEFRPLKPIFDFARAWWPYLLVLLLLAALGWYLYKWYKQKQAEPAAEPPRPFQPEPFQDPLKQLESSLRQLKSFTFESEEDYRQFYVGLGDAIRTYFEDLYKIPALESTSREIIRDLERRMVDERLVNQTRKVLREADMVKFARFRPTEEQAAQSLSVAADFLEVARNNDGARIEQMRRRHQSEMERQRERHEQKTQTPETETV